MTQPRAVLDDLRRWWGSATEPLVVPTSGATGTPKRVVLSHRALRASVSATQNRLGGPGQWLLDLPVSHIAGIQVLLRSLAAGTEPVIRAEYPSWRDAVAALRAERRYTALVPTQLHRLDAAGLLTTLRDFDAVLVGAAPTPDRLRVACRDSGVTLVETYGMTETCGGCVYDGVPLDGVRVRTDASGRVQIAGPVLFDGYEDDPGGTAEVLRDGWLTTSDLGRVTGDQRLEVLGRVDDIVVSGGVNVPLPAVDVALQRLPGVRDAVAVGVPDPEWGARVVGCLVPEPASTVPDLARLRELCTGSLPRTWLPREVVLLDALPTLPSGKVDRPRLLRLLRRAS